MRTRLTPQGRSLLGWLTRATFLAVSAACAACLLYSTDALKGVRATVSGWVGDYRPSVLHLEIAGVAGPLLLFVLLFKRHWIVPAFRRTVRPVIVLSILGAIVFTGRRSSDWIERAMRSSPGTPAPAMAVMPEPAPAPAPPAQGPVVVRLFDNVMSREANAPEPAPRQAEPDRHANGFHFWGFPADANAKGGTGQRAEIFRRDESRNPPVRESKERENSPPPKPGPLPAPEAKDMPPPKADDHAPEKQQGSRRNPPEQDSGKSKRNGHG